jgi:succinate dehydrogenase / fumarate reductase flavoprotein subunit
LDDAQIQQGEREALAPFERHDGENPYEMHRKLQETMQNLVGIYRTREDMKRALEELDKLKQRRAKVSVEGSRMFNPGWHLSLELKSMLTVSEAVARSALAREESRGAHSRIDFPELSAEWGKKHNVIRRGGAGMTLSQEAALEIPEELKQILAEEK